MTTTGPSAIDYTSRDYAALRESMLAYATDLLPDWKGATTGDPNDFGVVLVELFAYEGDILSYYGDRIANESFLSTATQRGSVLAHAALLDYTPRSATAASTTLQITVTSPETEVTIPAGFQVSTAADGTGDTLTYETTQDVTFSASATPVSLSVPALEGQTVADEVLATSCGDLDADYTLASTPVIADSLIVSVVETPDGASVVWFRVNNLLDAGPQDNAYSISLDENDALTVHFGDGVNGRVPPRGAVVHATYRTGGGADGNVEAGTITDIVDETDIVYPDPVAGQPPVDPDTVQPPSIEVTNTQAATGGTDSESLDSIRVNAPRALRARERAVSLEDFEALALSVPSVQLAKAKAVASVYTNVVLYIAPPGGDQPDQDTLNAVVAYFQTRKLANVTVVCAGPQYVSIDVELEIIVDPRYSQSSVKQAVSNALQNLLSFDNVEFGGRVALSSVYTAASRVEGVTSVVVSNMSRDGAASATDVVLRDNELPIQGRFSLIASGGVVNSGASDDLVGDGSSTVSPQPSSAPIISGLRCDPNSTHVELVWNAGANSEYWDVVVAYLNARGEIVQTTIVGPFARTQAIIDLPLIGLNRAANIGFTTRAYNSNAGPVTSPSTITAYVCEVGTAPPPTSGGGDVGTPPVVVPPPSQGTDVPTDIATTSITRTGTDSFGEPVVNVRWDWTVPAHPPTRYVYFIAHYDSAGRIIAGGQQSGPHDGSTGFFLENDLSCPPDSVSMRYYMKVLNADGSLGATSNVATAILPAAPVTPRGAPNAPTISSFSQSGGQVSFVVTATTSDNRTTDLIFKEIVRDSVGNILYQSSIGDVAPGQPLTITGRDLSSNYGGIPATYEVQAADISADNYGPSSARQSLTSTGGSTGSGPAAVPAAPTITNRTRTGPVGAEYTVGFTAAGNLDSGACDQLAMIVVWHPQGYTDTVVVPGHSGTYSIPYSQQYTDANSFTSVTVTVQARAAGHTDSTGPSTTTSFPT